MPSIATNVAANQSLFYLNRNSENQSSSLGKISSGSRIVKASDDAAGAAVSDQLQSDITSLNVVAQTVKQVDSLLQIADGGLQRVGEILQRLKGLATQFNSGTLDATSQGFINDEYDALGAELALVKSSTTFNGTALLDGAFTQTVVFGVAATDTLAIDLTTGTVGANTTDVDLAGLGLPAIGTGITGAGDITTIDTAIGNVGTARATVGALQSAVEFQGEVVSTQINNLGAAKSAIADVDIAQEQTNFTNFQVLTEAAIAGLSQANQISQSLLSLLR